MTDWYSGFDALDYLDYNEVMEALAIAEMEDEIATEQAAYYFENELEKDGEGR